MLQYDYLVLRFGELSLKGKNKKDFVRQLAANVRSAMKVFPDVKVKKRFDHIEIDLNDTPYLDVAEELKPIFGIQTILPAVKTASDVESIQEKALELIHSVGEAARTFKISTRRKYKLFSHNSMEMNHKLGGYILYNTDHLKVDVHKPDLDLRVEIYKNETKLYGQTIAGAGGLPVGTAGKVMLMLSGGIDSPVAGHMLQKRGATVEAIHFHSPPYTNDRARQKVLDLADKLKAAGIDLKLHIVPFTETQLAIRDEMPENYRMTIMRRMMMRMAEKLAEREGVLAIATGESLGQVASQTLESMNTINEVTTVPVLRPLLSMDKLEIMDIARKINTYDISIRPYEDCCTLFLPKSPKTKPNREQAAKFEQHLPVQTLLTNALQETETINIGQDSNLIDDLL